jgi:hypothetical protein
MWNIYHALKPTDKIMYCNQFIDNRKHLRRVIGTRHATTGQRAYYIFYQEFFKAICPDHNKIHEYITDRYKSLTNEDKALWDKVAEDMLTTRKEFVFDDEQVEAGNASEDDDYLPSPSQSRRGSRKSSRNGVTTPNETHLPIGEQVEAGNDSEDDENGVDPIDTNVPVDENDHGQC